MRKPSTITSEKERRGNPSPARSSRNRSRYAIGEQLTQTIWSPILRIHRLTLEQMAILEPALSETLTAT